MRSTGLLSISHLFFTVYPISSVTAIEKQPYIQNQQIYIDTICPCIYGKNHNGGSGRNKKNLEKWCTLLTLINFLNQMWFETCKRGYIYIRILLRPVLIFTCIWMYRSWSLCEICILVQGKYFFELKIDMSRSQRTQNFKTTNRFSIILHSE